MAMEKQKNKIRQRSVFDTVSNVLIVLFCVLSIFPLYWLFTGAFKYSTDITKYPPDWIPSRITVSNWVKIFTEYPAWRWLFNSCFITLATTALIVLISAAAGYAISKLRFKGKKIIFALIIAELLIPMEIYVLPLYKMIFSMKLTGKYLGYILPNIAVPFGAYLMKNSFDTIPDEITEASAIDGCGRIRFFFTCGIPLTKPGIGALAILSCVRVWNNYIWQMLMGDPVNKVSLTLPVALKNLIESSMNYTDYGMMYVAATLTALPMIILFFAFQKYFTAGITSGAVKG